MYTCFLVYYSPSPSLMYCIRYSSASLSSSPLQISSISSPDFMHAPSTESTLFALATFFSSYINVTFDLNSLPLAEIAGRRKCNPVGFLIIIFVLPLLLPLFGYISINVMNCQSRYFRCFLTMCCPMTMNHLCRYRLLLSPRLFLYHQFPLCRLRHLPFR